jgi:hypothetical protein
MRSKAPDPAKLPKPIRYKKPGRKQPGMLEKAALISTPLRSVVERKREQLREKLAAKRASALRKPKRK